MTLRTTAIAAAIMAVAAALMFLTAPISGGLAGIISVPYDMIVPESWRAIPIINLGPMFIVWLGYCVGLLVLVLGATRRSSNGGPELGNDEPIEELEIDGHGGELVQLVQPSEEPKEITSDPSEHFILDECKGLGSSVADAIVDEHRDPFRLDHMKAYGMLVEMLVSRGMRCMCINIEQFRKEWDDGVMCKTEWMAADGSGQGMIVYGCPTSDFTKVVEMLVQTATWRPPTAMYTIDFMDRSYEVLMAHGQIVSISAAA